MIVRLCQSSATLLFLALLVLACSLSSIASDLSATIEFSNAQAEDVHMYWVEPGSWLPPVPPTSSSDEVHVRCRVGRRVSTLADDAYHMLRREQQQVHLNNELQVRGEFVITVRKDWAPLGSQHFLDLVTSGFFNGSCLFRAVQGFLVQFGVSSDAKLQREWGHKTIRDDPPRPDLLPLQHGTLAFAGHGDDSRTSQLWLSFAAGVAGEQPWETPVGYVHPRDGLDIVDGINTEYGDLKDFGGNAPDPAKLDTYLGIEHLRTEYPNIDYFESCKIAEDYSPVESASNNEHTKLIGVGTISPGGKAKHNTFLGHQFVAKLGGPNGKHLATFKATRKHSHHQLSDTDEL